MIIIDYDILYLNSTSLQYPSVAIGSQITRKESQCVYFATCFAPLGSYLLCMISVGGIQPLAVCSLLLVCSMYRQLPGGGACLLCEGILYYPKLENMLYSGRISSPFMVVFTQSSLRSENPLGRGRPSAARGFGATREVSHSGGKLTTLGPRAQNSSGHETRGYPFSLHRRT